MRVWPHPSCVSITVSTVPRSVTLCSRPDLMRYQVYSCANTSEVYEDRLYRCYGVFQELGLTYTAVRRLDTELVNSEDIVLIIYCARY